MKLRTPRLAATVATLLLTISGPAQADPFGTNTIDTGPMADSPFHDWCEALYNFGPPWNDPMDDAMYYLESHSDMSVGKLWSRCTNNTDILFTVKDSASMTPFVRGSTSCRVWVTFGDVCDSFVVLFNSDLLLTYTQRRKTACHEIGHSVGLSHAPTGDDCMISGNYGYAGYNQHHVSHINYNY